MITVPTLSNVPLRTLKPVRFSCLVKSTLNGQHLFDGTTKIDFRPPNGVKSEAVYLFDSLTISGNVPEWDFIDSIDDVYLLNLLIWSKASAQSPTPAPAVPVVGYTDHAPYVFAWQPSGDPDALQMSVSGKLNVSPWMTENGLIKVVLSVVLSGYEISDRNWINEYLAEDADQTGSNGRGVRVVLDDGLSQDLRRRNF